MLDAGFGLSAAGVDTADVGGVVLGVDADVVVAGGVVSDGVVVAVVVDGVDDVEVVDGVVEPAVVELGVVDVGVVEVGPVIAVEVDEVLGGEVVVDGLVAAGDVVVAAGVDVVEGLVVDAFLSASLILPQISCAVSFGSVLPAVVSAGFVVDVADGAVVTAQWWTALWWMVPLSLVMASLRALSSLRLPAEWSVSPGRRSWTAIPSTCSADPQFRTASWTAGADPWC